VVLTVVKMSIMVFLVVMLYHAVKFTIKMEVICSSKTTQCHKPEDHDFKLENGVGEGGVQ
jgi:hypothetical protein